MKYNILVGGAAGQGVDTLSSLLEKLLKRKGYFVHSNKDYMSRVRGGHNFTQIRFGTERVYSHWPILDILLALDEQTVKYHEKRLGKGGIILCDEAGGLRDERAVSIPISKIAREVRNNKAAGSAAAGAVIGLLGESIDIAEKLFYERFDSDVAVSNYEAFKKGYETVGKRFDISSPGLDDSILINGNEAIALGALAGGLGFFASYPMTPATSIMKQLSIRQKAAGIVVEQVEDELSAINMALGAAYAGVRSMTATSGGGFALMTEGLSLQGAMELPLVVVNSQRPGPSTGIATRTEQSDLSFVLSAGHGEFPRMVLAVKNPQDAFYQTVRALNIAEKYQVLVIMLTDQYLADAADTISPFDFGSISVTKSVIESKEIDDRSYKRYRMTECGVSPRIIPGSLENALSMADSHEHDEYGHITESAEMRSAMMDKRMRKLEGLKSEIQEPDFFGCEQPELLLTGWGSMYGPLREAVELLQKDGIAAGALVFGDLLPFPGNLLARYSSVAKKTVNVEQNFTGQLSRLIRQETGISMDCSILSYDGRQMCASTIYERVRKEVL
ncbi:MAG TPA: 2-oxoacid:acceptor oxidoreductase subunit alpha [Candidatus Nitrosocosmicus sp.]|nr:2-oxoacid:acceptor oxidoreductase subunit alpha [Candidatus Nitrosocosmicus sp.]